MTTDYKQAVQIRIEGARIEEAEIDRATTETLRSQDRTAAEFERSGDRQPGLVRRVFTVLATRAARAVGSVWAFLIAALVVIVWAVLGPIFDYSDTWQLVINTGTTIVTFLMVFLIQNSQNRDGKAMQLKLDELILTAKEARNDLINIEKLSDEELDSMAQTYENEKARRAAAGQER
jgi:low affinity Fe/Cu permease